MKKILKLGIFGLIIASCSGFVFFSSIQKAFSASSSNGQYGNYNYFYDYCDYNSDILGNCPGQWYQGTDNLAICESSGPTCNSASGDFDAFNNPQSVGNNQTSFSGNDPTNENFKANLIVNNCSPGQGTLQILQTPVQTVKISLNTQSYQSALATAQKQNAGNVSLLCSTGTGSGKGNINIEANFVFSPNTLPSSLQGATSATAGPITFTLMKGKTTLSTTHSNTAQVSTQNTETYQLTGSFTNVAAGNYQVCTKDLAPSPQCGSISVPNSNTVVLNGTLTNSAYNPNSPSASQDNCDSSSFSMSWLVCPFVGALQGTAKFLNDNINKLLTIPVNTYFNNSCTGDNAASPGNVPASCQSSGTNYQIWSNMRDIAMSLLVIAALIMVIATALDVGPFDAYTVKKLLPRILIAVFVITFSWQLGRFLIQFSNDLGQGVSSLIYDAAGVSSSTVLAGIGTGLFGWLGVGALGLGAAAFVTFALVGPLAVLMLLLPVILAFLIAFFVLLFRQLILVVCVVFAPIALVMFILPGTQKIWKLWKDSFAGALFVFPLISGVIAIGAVLAYITDNNSSAANCATSSTNCVTGWLAPVTALVLYIGPFFLIPKLVKMSTGALGSIASVAGNVNKRGSEALNKWRANTWAQRREKAKAGDLWTGKNRFSKYMNRRAVGIGAGARGNFGLFGERGRAAISNVEQVAASDKMKDARFVQQTFNDHVRLALLAGSSKRAETALKKRYPAMSDSDISKNIAAASAIGFNGATRLGALKAEAANKSRNFETIGDAADMINEIAEATRVNPGDLRSNFAFEARNAGRWDLGDMNGTEVGLTGEARKAALNRQMIGGWKKGSLYQHGNGQSISIDNIANAFRDLSTSSPEGARDFAIFHRELSSVSQNATGAVAETASKVAQEDQAEYERLMTNPALPNSQGAVGAKQATETVEVTLPDPTDPSKTITRRESHLVPRKADGSPVRGQDQTYFAEDVNQSARVYRYNPNEQT